MEIKSESTQQIIDAVSEKSLAGAISFGEVVGKLIEANVESYLADYRTGTTTYYLPTGETYVKRLPVAELAIADVFDGDRVRESIRGAQSGEVKYPEFVRRTMSAGCVGYTVWIAGRHVSYFGRRGETHVENFPSR